MLNDAGTQRCLACWRTLPSSLAGLSMKSIALKPEKVSNSMWVPIRIDVMGDYHDFGSFVSGVASLSHRNPA